MLARLGWNCGAGLVVAALLSGCAPGVRPIVSQTQAGVAIPSTPGPALSPVRFDQMPGWTDERLADALPAFLAGCAQPAAAADEAWRTACAEGRAVQSGDQDAARRFFEARFQPHIASSDGNAAGLVTGYYEPELRGARKRGGIYQTPLLRRPAGAAPGRVLPSRAQIERGALNRERLEIAWVANPVDAFFLHIQGSGRIRLPDGGVMRVGYAGQNGHLYVPIGRVLVDRGELALEEVSMRRIRAWLASHKREARGVMEQNPSYIFFREITGVRSDEGPPGNLGAPLTPLRSVAVDRAHIPLGTPVWLDTLDALDGSPWRRLAMAQDVGGAIRGPTRVDIFFGWGPEAEERAGRMRQPGTVYVLLPR